MLSYACFGLACLVATANVTQTLIVRHRKRVHGDERGFSWLPLATGVFAVAAYALDDGTLGGWALAPLALEPVVLFPILHVLTRPFTRDPR